MPQIDPLDTEPVGRIEMRHAVADQGADLMSKIDAIFGIAQGLDRRVTALEGRRADAVRKDNAPAVTASLAAPPGPQMPIVDSRCDEALARRIRAGDPLAREIRIEQLQRRMGELQRREQQRKEAEALKAQRARQQVPLSEREEREIVAIQARCDDAYVNIGLRAPAPALYERPQLYRRRVLGRLQRYSRSEDLRTANLGMVADGILDRLEPTILAEASRADAILCDLTPGEERCIERNDGGQRVRDFYRGGGGTFIADYKAQNRRAVFNDPVAQKAARLLGKAGV